MPINEVVYGIVAIVVGVVMLTSLGPTIVTSTATNGQNATGHNEPAGQLADASGVSKVMYGLIEFLYPIIGVLFMVGGGMAIGKKAKILK